MRIKTILNTLREKRSKNDIIIALTTYYKGTHPCAPNLIIGDTESGITSYIVDDLQSCTCGCKERPLLMFKKNKVDHSDNSKPKFFAVCSVCGRYTRESDLSTTIDNWNNDNDIEGHYEIIKYDY